MVTSPPTPPDVGQVEAGVYELVAQSWDEPVDYGSFDPQTGLRALPMTYKRHVRGDLVTLSKPEARRLVGCGAVVHPGSREQGELQAAEVTFLAVKAQRDAAQARLEAAAALLRAGIAGPGATTGSAA